MAPYLFHHGLVVVLQVLLPLLQNDRGRGRILQLLGHTPLMIINHINIVVIFAKGDVVEEKEPFRVLQCGFRRSL